MEHTESGYLAFELSADATVYVTFDSRAVTLPNWMSGFSDIHVYRLKDFN